MAILNMLRHLFAVCLLALPVFTVESNGPVCRTKLPSDHQSEVYVNNLKWQEPKTSSAGGALQLECASGFLHNELKNQQATFTCQGGLYNATYKYEDLLCRSDFHKLDRVTKIPANQLPSSVLTCSTTGWEVYSVGREAAGMEKLLYYVCLDRNTMRTKFVMRPASSTKPVVNFHSREGDEWGYDGFGNSAEERKRLSQGYVKNLQQRRTTQAFSDKYNQGKTYPYYFNRGHLVAYTDFSNYDDQKTTVQYINAAPQWEVLNKESWSLVEREARTILQTHPEEWEIYTGTYGTVQSPKGPVFLVANFDKNGKFLKGQLPLPMLFWKMVFNTKDRSKSRVFVGVNNPELKTTQDIGPAYKLCQHPVRGADGKVWQGGEYKGFTYECPVDEFLAKLSVDERIVKK